MNRPPTWLLLDGNNHAHRDCHAAGVAQVPSLFGGRIDAMMETWQPARVICAFDAGETFRHRIEPRYKSGRERHPDVAEAIAAVRDECLAAAVDVLEAPDFEADDIIATMTELGREAGNRIVIASADKDLHQLIRPGEVLQLIECKRSGTKLDPTWRNAENLVAKYGVRPDQWVDYRIMVGDASDNLPGIDKIGSVTAAKILKSCDSLDGFYCNPHAAPIGPAAATRMINAKPQVPRLRELMTLRIDVPLPETWSVA